jgi:hypothetical protein
MRVGRDSAVAGFSLIECVVALGLLGAALVTAASLLTVLSASTVRTEMNRAMLRELENTFEMMRAGVVVVETGPVAFATPARACPDHLRVNALVRETDVPALFEVVLRAECGRGAVQLSKTMRTQVWEP